MAQLFGTDGIRGIANRHPMTAEMAVKIGRAIARRFGKAEQCIVIGRDTRLSGPMLESALTAGICAMGTSVMSAGIMPTPAVAFLTTAVQAAAGVVVSASHNPYSDNGIKVFSSAGRKLTEAEELQLEELILDDGFDQVAAEVEDPGTAEPIISAGEHYVQFLTAALPEKRLLQGLDIVIDCSNGAVFQTAPVLFAEAGATVETLFAAPDGKNINRACGSQHPQTLATAVREKGAAAGLAFDGDGDRLIAVDELGEVLTGDQVLAICAAFLKKNGRLKNDTVVSTVMSNLGLGNALKQMGARHVTCAVGDRNVVEAMQACGAVLGGEDSGHTVFLADHTTGDGMLTALKLLEILVRTGKTLSELKTVMTVYPQALISVDVRRKPALESVPEVMLAVGEAERSLKGQGRVLVRYSGTQMQCRVMVEGPTESATRRWCREIADVVAKTLN
jgi:phosphoglucosamine mutase